MKKYFFILFLMILPLSVNAKGGIPILYGDGEEVSKVMSLPSDDEFTIEGSDGRWYHADLGVLHKQFSIFYIPIWNYGEEKYVLYTDTKIGNYDFTYADLSRDDISYLQSKFSGIPTSPELPFWDAIGGKLLFLVIAGALILMSKS